MFGSGKSRVITAIVVAILVTAPLNACASADEGNTAAADANLVADSTASLGETKPPVQLLRNETANRLPAELVEEVVIAKDASSPCKTEKTDPKGYIRAWRSSVRVVMKDDLATPVKEVVDGVVQSFVDQGWIAGTFGSAAIIELTSETSFANIHLSSKKARPEEGIPATVQIQVSGPCVTTDGADSDEVKSLGAEEEDE